MNINLELFAGRGCVRWGLGSFYCFNPDLIVENSISLLYDSKVDGSGRVWLVGHISLDRKEFSKVLLDFNLIRKIPDCFEDFRAALKLVQVELFDLQKRFSDV